VKELYSFITVITFKLVYLRYEIRSEDVFLILCPNDRDDLSEEGEVSGINSLDLIEIEDE
jgi:hypothetical protein